MSELTYQQVTTITVKDIYTHGVGSFSAWKIIALRPPMRNEYYIGNPEDLGNQQIYLATINESYPRLIVERKLAYRPYTTTITVKDMYGIEEPKISESQSKYWEQTSEFRPAREGEGYLNVDGCIYTVTKPPKYSQPFIIVKALKK